MLRESYATMVRTAGSEPIQRDVVDAGLDRDVLGRNRPSHGGQHAEWRYGHVMTDADHVAENDRERQRMRELIERLDDEQLRTTVNEYWTVAGVLGHIAFWDARVLALAAKLDRDVPFSPSDAEPEDVDWINDASRPLTTRSRPMS